MRIRVDRDGVVLDIPVQRRRDAKAAKRFFRWPLQGLPDVPRVIVTNELRSYSVECRPLLRGVEHRQSRYFNNRAENPRRSARCRERQMQRIKSPEQALDFPSCIPRCPHHHLSTANFYRAIRAGAFNI